MKKNQRVRIKKDLVAGRTYGHCILYSNMSEYLGKRVTITSIMPLSDSYALDIDNLKESLSHRWSGAMLEEDTPNVKSGYIDQSILDEAKRVWGTDSQLEMIEEECMELALAIHRLKRLRGDMTEKENNVIDEIADVKIIIQQAEKLFGSEAVNKRVDFKMDRLVDRLFEYKNKKL